MGSLRFNSLSLCSVTLLPSLRIVILLLYSTKLSFSVLNELNQLNVYYLNRGYYSVITKFQSIHWNQSAPELRIFVLYYLCTVDKPHDFFDSQFPYLLMGLITPLYKTIKRVNFYFPYKGLSSVLKYNKAINKCSTFVREHITYTDKNYC